VAPLTSFASERLKRTHSLAVDALQLRLPLLRVKNTRLAFAHAIEQFTVKPYQPSGIDKRAMIVQNTVIGAELRLYLDKYP
jgi:hypothetical protein